MLHPLRLVRSCSRIPLFAAYSVIDWERQHVRGLIFAAVGGVPFCDLCVSDEANAGGGLRKANFFHGTRKKLFHAADWHTDGALAVGDHVYEDTNQSRGRFSRDETPAMLTGRFAVPGYSS